MQKGNRQTTARIQAAGRYHGADLSTIERAESRRSEIEADIEITEARSIFHKIDEAIHNHVFCEFLALVLM